MNAKGAEYAEAVYYHEPAKDLRRFGYCIRNRPRGDFEIEGVSTYCANASPNATNRLRRHGLRVAGQA
jgi:hypothetical protein